MLSRLLLLFIVLPLAELAILLWLSQWTSPAVTMALVIGSGLVGALLARSQGLQVFRRIRQEVSQGRLPSESLVDGLLILLAGALLLTPGVLTDLLGLSLLVPPIRRRYRSALNRWFRDRFRLRRVWRGSAGDAEQRRSAIIDSQVVETPRDTTEPRPDR